MSVRVPLVIFITVTMAVVMVLTSATDDTKRLVLHSDVDIVAAFQRLEQEVHTLQRTVSDQNAKLLEQNETVVKLLALNQTMTQQLVEQNLRLTEQNQTMAKQLVEQSLKLLEQNQTITQLLQQNLTIAKQLIDATDSINKLQIASGVGSTYVRWGRTVCDTNGTELVYTGFAGGANYNYPGGAAEYICLTSQPLWGAYDDAAQPYSARIFGAEYEFGENFPDGGARFFGNNMYQHDAPCAVCRSSRPTTIMIPGRNKCFPGWTHEYSGYLVSGRGQSTYDKSASQYICLDSKPEVELGDRVDENGKMITLVEGVCGSLKCPPYVNYRELTCVVCSK